MQRNLYVIFIMCTCALLTACDSGEDNTPTINSEGAEVVATYQGSVGDGPVIGATVIIRDQNGVVLNSIISDVFANYNITISAREESYPLTIEAVGGIDLVTQLPPTFELISTVLHPSDKIANINPFSTFIVRTAEAMGGLTSENVEQATAVVLRELNFGFDGALIRDPIATEITESEVASLVKVSESLGELVRRTQISASENNIPVSENDVISVLSADLTDGVLDGKGGPGANNEIALRAKVIAGEVVLEALFNRLRVNNVVATAALDASIATIMPGASPMPNTGQVVSTAEMIVQLETAIKIGQRIAPSSAFSALMNSINSLVGVTPEAVANLLPGEAQVLLDDTLNAIAMLSADEIIVLNFPVIDEVNYSPVITGVAPGSVDEGAAYLFEPESSDVDGDPLVYSIENKPSWAEFDVATGALSGTPGFDQAGQFSAINISVTDGKEIVALEPFAITVENVNRLPSVSGTPLTGVIAGSGYEFTPVAVDPDGDLLAFTVINKPAWSNFNIETGQLSGLPNNSHVGLYPEITIQVSDGIGSVSLPSFSVVVGLNNSAAVIGGVPASVVAEASAYSFMPNVSDADGDVLTFSIINRPSWAQFNANSGQLSGVPGYSDSGVYNNIQISVSDGEVTASLSPFDITVEHVNRMPTIGGVPAISTEEGALYRFIPFAEDADGDVLSFSIINRPAWANFNSVTGELSGIPEGVDVGSYLNITVSVSDGEQVVALANFSIVVSAYNTPVTGSATLSWIAPATRVDGSEFLLSEIGGYRIYYGSSPDNLTLLIDLEDPTATQYVVEGLSEGVHYFSVSIYDAVGSESERSAVRSKAI